MDLNTFGEKLVAQLSRIANAAETIESVMKSGKAPAVSSTAATPKTDAAKETAAEKKTRLAAEAAAAAAANAPKADRAAVNKALVAVKDTISKEAAQAVYSAYKYTAMSKIEEKDFDAILADAEKELEDFANKTGKYEADDAPLDSGDDDL